MGDHKRRRSFARQGDGKIACNMEVKMWLLRIEEHTEGGKVKRKGEETTKKNVILKIPQWSLILFKLISF